MPTSEELKILQALPLDIKIMKTRQRTREWIDHYGENGVYVAFSGGKDSTVLLDIVRSDYPNVGAVFVNTGLEYPEIQRFVNTFDNVTVLRPKLRFDEVIKKYGYPIIGKEVAAAVYETRTAWKNGHEARYRLKKFNGEVWDKNGKKSQFNLEKWKSLLNTDFPISDRCCNVMKKAPSKAYTRKTGKVPITAQLASESRLRRQQWLRHGCNAFDDKTPKSNPMSFWTEQDVLRYITERGLKIASVYGDIVPVQKQPNKLLCTGCQRTGCIFCGFGANWEKGENRFEKLKRTHPRQYEYCMEGGDYGEDGMWRPNQNGLGMKHVLDVLNKIYGDGFIRY